APHQPRTPRAGHRAPHRNRSAMKIGVVGGGSWGTAIAAHLVRAGHDTHLWLRNSERARAIEERRENARFLPGIPLPDGLRVTTVLPEAVAGAETVFVVIPSEFCRGVYRELGPVLPASALVVSATKGLEL